MSNSPMCSGRETRSVAAERGQKGSRTEKLITCWVVNWVALRNDLISDDYSAAFEMMDSDDVLRGR